MRSRNPSVSNFSYSFGPGPLTPAVKAIVIVNVALFALSFLRVVDFVGMHFGFTPAEAIAKGYVWQFVSYMFLHVSVFHILFNMLSLWMFGVELERKWGSKFFLKYYFLCGAGAALVQAIVSFLPIAALQQVYSIPTVGASGAIFGLLLAYAMYFPERHIYMYFLFPVRVKYFVMIIGGISLLSSMGSGGSGIAHTTHLGGLVAGYLYLKSGRVHVMSEIKYRLIKWRINRMRRRFDVYSGGRADDVDRRVH